MKRVHIIAIALIGFTLSACVNARPHRISTDEARAKLTTFANEQLELRSQAVPPGHIVFPRISEQSWQSVKLSETRWLAEIRPGPYGLLLRASIDELGKNPKLEAARIYLP
jgi:hypothetical protein